MNAKRIIGLAIAMAALPAQGALAATGTQSITADVANTLEATFPGAYAWGSLTPGVTATSSEQTINVKSNATWGLKVASDIADGRMTEWTGLVYVPITPKVLTNAVNWRMTTLGGVAQGSTTYAALSSTQALVTGSQAITNDSGKDVGVTYRQAPSFADAYAGVVNDYRILVTYDAAQGY
jgi:hypothetical protein